MPYCKKCETNKPLAAFRINGTRPDGSPRPRTICKACGSQWKEAHVEPKRCAACKKVKPASDFPRQGMHPYCRVCRTEKSSAYKRGPGRKAHAARMQRYNKNRYKNDPSYPLKVRARNAVHLAVTSGLLTKPKRCPTCNQRKVIHGHHHKGYDKKNWLNVLWRCARCHRQDERNEQEEAR